MKKMKWILISVTGLLAVGGGGGWFALRSWIEKNATPDSVVQRMEEEWNCRADVGKIEVSLFSNPARILVSEFSLMQRDAEVGKPLAQRKIADGAGGVLKVRRAMLEVDTQDILGGRLHIKNLRLSDIWLREEITPEGISILQETFRKPLPSSTPSVTPPLPVPVQPAISAAPVPEPAPAPPPPPGAKPGAPAVPEGSVAHAVPKEKQSNLPFGVVIDEALLENGIVRIRNRQARTTTNFNELNLRITDVDVDPGNLAQHNQCKIDLSARVDSSGRTKVGDETKDLLFANFTLKAQGLIMPYDQATGQLAPHGQTTLALPKGGVFGGVQTIGQVADKSFGKLKENFGIDVSDLVIGGALQEDVKADVNYEGGRVQFQNDIRFVFPEYVVTLRKDSWVNGAADDHNMRLQLLPLEALEKRIRGDVTNRLGDTVYKLALSIFNDGQGHLAFDMASDGRLSKPRTRLDGNAGALQQLFKGLIK